MSNQSWLKPKYVESEVNGEKLRFFPISMRLLFRLRDIGKSLAKAIASIFNRDEDHVGSTTRNVTEGEQVMQVTEIEAISPELAELREKKRVEAITDVVDTLTDPQSGDVVAEIIMDSLRENFDRNPSPQQIEEFRNALDAESLVQLMAGVGAANKKLFDPLLKKVPELGAVVEGRFGNKEAEKTPSSETVSTGTT